MDKVSILARVIVRITNRILSCPLSRLDRKTRKERKAVGCWQGGWVPCSCTLTLPPLLFPLHSILLRIQRFLWFLDNRARNYHRTRRIHRKVGWGIGEGEQPATTKALRNRVLASRDHEEAMVRIMIGTFVFPRSRLDRVSPSREPPATLPTRPHT